MGPVEAMNFIDEQDRAGAHGAALAGGGEDLPEIRDPGKHRRNGLEGEIRRVGQEPGDGGLAAARRTPQDHGGEPLVGNHAAKGTVAAQQVVLTQHLGDGLGPKPVGQGAWRIGLEQARHRVSLPAPG